VTCFLGIIDSDLSKRLQSYLSNFQLVIEFWTRFAANSGSGEHPHQPTGAARCIVSLAAVAEWALWAAKCSDKCRTLSAQL
jgi:hypothetical protein